jgi:hypothetical protein
VYKSSCRIEIIYKGRRFMNREGAVVVRDPTVWSRCRGVWALDRREEVVSWADPYRHPSSAPSWEQWLRYPGEEVLDRKGKEESRVTNERGTQGVTFGR